MRNALIFLVLALAGTAMAADTGLQVEIQSPSAGFTVEDGTTSVEVEGIASAIGGVRYLDIMFVVDTSSSLRRSDPSDYRAQGAIGLVQNLSPKSDIKIGVVSFDSKSQIAQSMTSDREAVMETLRLLPRSGSTNIAAGITSALAELERNGRPGSSKVIMLFTDGMSNKNKAYDAAVEATKRGIPIQTLMLGQDTKGGKTMDTIAWATGGTFIPVSDPSKLPEAFLNLRTTGVDSVTLSVNGSEPVPARLAGGTFAGSVPVAIGENRIVAFATSLDGDTQESEILVNVRDTSCAALEVLARKDGQPALSLSDRAVEVVVDASQSMWGQIEGRSKMEIAKTTLEEVTYWLPDDMELALRAYGNTSAPKQNNCTDSALLVPFRDNNRDYIRQAIAGLRPTGQTPIAYALNQVARDFEASQSDRIVVLVTDGIESCGGDPVTAAYALQQQGIVVHVIGFGLGSAADEDASSLQAIAAASGGRYVTAGSAEELKSALAETVATSFSVYRGSTEVASGSLGSAGIMLLPEGDYRVQLHSNPPVEALVSLAPRDGVTLTLEKSNGEISPFEQRDQLPYTSCGNGR
ncbi:MAG: VWA domain-containing protein [Chromatiales bacterium]|nr:MAG: VWA domain-containing protein [Chromatiales bacterium]